MSTLTQLDPRLAPYRAAFEELRGGPAYAPAPWLGELRDKAIDAFLQLGFPTTDEELWRTTSVAPIARTPFTRADEAAAQAVPAALLETLGLRGAFRGREAVFVNGRFAPHLSSLEALRGARVRSLHAAVREDPELVERDLGYMATGIAEYVFTGLNTALFEDGALVEIDEGAQPGAPIHLLYLSLPVGPQPTHSHPRTLVVCGAGSRAGLIESYCGPQGAVYLANAVTEVVLDDGARLDHAKLQRESEAAFHVAMLTVEQGRDTVFASHNLTLGAALSRNDIDVLLEAPGSECRLDGLFLGRGAQHLDTHTRVDHAAPQCASRQLYKGVLDDRAQGVFEGLVQVRDQAQKTDAWQANRNLLLSAEALVHSRPRLEIHADDVRCKHGSTTGQLDPLALFYLRSRGLDEGAAQALLVHAFAAEIARGLPWPELRAAVGERLRERLAQAPREEGA